MADENIVIAVQDKVPDTVAAKFKTIAGSARDAYTAISQLNQQLNATSAANGLTAAMNAIQSQTSALATSVGNLTTQISNLNNQINQLNTGLNNVNASSNVTTTNITNVTNSTGRLNTSLINLAAGFQVFKDISASVEKIGAAFKQVVVWQAGLDRFNIGMKTISENAAGAGANTKFITDLVARLGLDLDTAASSFIKFSAATKGTLLQGQQTQQIFQSIAEAATVLHLSTSQLNGAFLAIEQMASKGVISMEELRRQLNNHLPGAMQIAADAMGVTTSQLNQMIKSGQLAADDFLPKFAEAVHRHYGDAVVEASDSAQASLNRFGTAWTNLTRSIADSGLGNAAKGQLNIVSDALNSISEAMSRAKAAGSGFFGQAAAGTGAALSFLNPVNAFGYQAQSIEGLKTQIKQWQDQLKTTTDWYQQKQLAFNIQNSQRLLTEKMAGMPQSPAANSVDLSPEQKAAINAQQATADLQKFLNNGKHLTKAEQLQKNFKDIDDQFAQATAHMQKGTEQYNQALAAATARKAELQENYDKAGLRLEHKDRQNALSDALAKLQGYIDNRKALLDTDLQNLQTQRNEGLITEKQFISQVGQARDSELRDLKKYVDQQAELAKGKDQLAVRERYVSESNKLEQQLVTNKQRTTAELTALDFKTTQTAQSQLLALQQAGANRNQQNQDKLLGFGLSSEQQAELTAYQQIEQRANQARLALTQQATKLGTLDSPAYVKGLQDISNAEQQQLAQEKAYFSQREQLQADWKNGALSAFAEFQDKARNVASQTQQLFTTAFDGLTDALTKFVTTGKLSFGDLVNTIIAGIVKMELQAAESQIFSGLAGYFGIGGSAGGAVLAGFASGGYTGDMGAHKVAGVVHGQEFVVPAHVVKQPGMLDMLQSMVGAKGYASGGYVGTPPALQAAPKGQSAQPQLTVNITNNASDQVAISAKQSTDSNGKPTLEIMATMLEGQLAGKIASGRGALHDSIQSKFGVRSQPGR